jgi:hypothetical protein
MVKQTSANTKDSTARLILSVRFPCALNRMVTKNQILIAKKAAVAVKNSTLSKFSNFEESFSAILVAPFSK